MVTWSTYAASVVDTPQPPRQPVKPTAQITGSGAVAQALAAAGRGVAIVTDDPRFDLARLRVLSTGHIVNIHLRAGWDPGNPHTSPSS